MPYLFMIGLLAIWLLPSSAIAAEAPATMPTVTSSATKLPADYPEDFSRPRTMAQARPGYTNAFGEDEAVPQKSAAETLKEDLMRPLDSPSRTSTSPAKAPAQK